MEDLMAAEAGVIAPGPLDGVEHATNGVEQAAGQQPEEAFRGKGGQQGAEGKDTQPAHCDVDYSGEHTRCGDPSHTQHQPGQS